MGIRFVALNVRLSHPDLFTPAEYKGKSRFGCTGVMPKAGAKLLCQQEGDNKGKTFTPDQALEMVAKESFGAKWQQKLAGIKGNAQKCCIRDGAAKGFPEDWLIALYRQEDQGRPAVVDGRKNPLAAADGVLYAGCYVNLSFDLYTAEDGIHGGLVACQFVKDGEAFGGGGPATADDFEAIAEGADADDLM